MKFEVSKIFENVLKREMEVLISEKSKQCQSGAVIDLATDRLIEAYFLKSEFDKMEGSRDFQKRMHGMEKSERERYQELLAAEREKNT